MRKTHIYICNSEYESFGLPTLEAMTCGATVVTTDTGGMRDFVKDNYNALVTNHHDINDIVEKVSLLVDNPIYYYKNYLQMQWIQLKTLIGKIVFLTHYHIIMKYQNIL